MFRSLLNNEQGTSVVEISLIAPLLLTLSLGAFDVSQMVARRTHLQEVTAEVAFVAMAAIANEDDDARLRLGYGGDDDDDDHDGNVRTNFHKVRRIAAASAGLDVSKVSIIKKVKCGTQDLLQSGSTDCSTGVEKSTFVQITLNDIFTPNWVDFGIGSPVPIQVVRLVQVS